MKRLAAFLILFSFSVMAVFGFAMMTHTMAGDTGVGCFAGLVGGEDCPLGATDIAIHHIAAYQVFSNSPVPAGLVVLGMVLASFIFAAWFYPLENIRRYSSGFARQKHEHLKNYFSSISQLQHWLALLEFSPAL